MQSYALERVSTTFQVIGTIAVAVRATLGGLVGDRLGAPVALTVGMVGTVLATSALVRSAVWKLLTERDVADAGGPPRERDGDASAFGR